MKITNMKKLAAACAVCAVFAMLTGCGKYIGRNGMRSESTVQTSNIQTDSAPTESVNGTESAAGSGVSEAESKAENKKRRTKSLRLTTAVLTRQPSATLPQRWTILSPI